MVLLAQQQAGNEWESPAVLDNTKENVETGSFSNALCRYRFPALQN
jgi:hypothetical protein